MAYKRVNTVRTRTIMAWPARWRSPQRGKHKPHPHTASLSLIIYYTRRNAHTGDETIKKGVVAESLALKYRHIFKNGQQKTFSAQRPSKTGEKTPNGQPTWNTAKFLKFGRKMANLATLTPRYSNVSTCCSAFPHTCRIHCLGRLERHNASIFLVLTSVPGWSDAEEKQSNACCRPCWEHPRM